MSKPQSIAYIIFRTRENTGSKVVFQQIPQLEKRGYKVFIYTLFGKSAKWFPNGIRSESIFYAFVRPSVDVVVATFWPTAYVAMILRARRKFYMILGWEEDFYSNKFIRYFARLTYLLPLRKIVLSDYLKDRLYAYTKKKEKVSKIVTFVLEDFFFTGHKKKKANLSKKVKILSVISWYNRYKGPDLLVEVIKNLKPTHPEYHFILVGREKKSFSPLVDSFYSNPSSEKLARLYKDSDVMLITSRVEGFYIPGLEAMASGLPVITTNSGGVLEYANKDTAIIAEDLKDVWEKDYIEKVIKNKSLHAKLVKNGLKMAEKYRRYTLDDMGKDLEKIYFQK